MAEPTTITQVYTVPSTGDLPGAWGTSAVNPNFVAIDGTFGGFTTIGLSSSTTLLLTNPGAPSPGAGPNQSQNACIYLTGTLTGNCVLLLTTPRKYVFHNQCAGINSFFVQVQPAAGTGAGTAVGLPPGEKIELFYDGTNVDFVNLGRVSSAFDDHGATAYRPWMNACTVRPYLIKDGSVYNISNYTALGTILGSTFGGNGISTFGVPDEMNRARIGVDTANTGRLTAAISGINGTTMGAAGGSQSMQQHSHGQQGTFGLSIFSFVTSTSLANGIAVGQPGGIGGVPFNCAANQNPVVILSGNTGTTGAGSSQNVQPSIVSFLPLIKT